MYNVKNKITSQPVKVTAIDRINLDPERNLPVDPAQWCKKCPKNAGAHIRNYRYLFTERMNSE